MPSAIQVNTELCDYQKKWSTCNSTHSLSFFLPLFLPPSPSLPHAGKYSKLCLTEEEQCEDMMLFLKLLSHLTSKDYLDFAPNSASVGRGTVEPVDVVVTGITIVLPLMSEETLKVTAKTTIPTSSPN